MVMIFFCFQFSDDAVSKHATWKKSFSLNIPPQIYRIPEFLKPITLFLHMVSKKDTQADFSSIVLWMSVIPNSTNKDSNDICSIFHLVLNKPSLQQGKLSSRYLNSPSSIGQVLIYNHLKSRVIHLLCFELPNFRTPGKLV